MKVLRIVGGLDPGYGGPPVSAVNSVIAVQRAGVATTLAYGMAPGEEMLIRPLVNRLHAVGVETVGFPYARLFAATAKRWAIGWDLSRWLTRARHGFDIVHCHGAWQGSTVATLGRRPHRQSCVLTPHESLTDFDIALARNVVTRLAKRWLRPRFLREFDLIVAASALEAKDSVPVGIAARSTVIRHPVYDEQAHRPVAHSLPPAAEGLRLGYIGRLHRKKNVDVLIRALAELPAGARLVVAGTGPEETTLRALANRLGVAARVDWLGFVQGDVKTAFFRAIHLLAMPSDYECFGMAAAEAMSEGIPVLVAPQTGVAEVVQTHGGGLVVTPEPQSVATALGGLLHNDAALRQYAAEAVSAAGQEFSFAAHGTALCRAYEGLIARAGDGIGTVVNQNQARSP